MYNRKRSRIGTVYNNVAFKRGIRFIILYLKTGSKIYIYVSAIYVVFFKKRSIIEQAKENYINFLHREENERIV